MNGYGSHNSSHRLLFIGMINRLDSEQIERKVYRERCGGWGNVRAVLMIRMLVVGILGIRNFPMNR